MKLFTYSLFYGPPEDKFILKILYFLDIMHI